MSPSGIGQPSFLGSLIPFYGSGRAAIDNFQTGHWVKGIFNSALAISDVFLVKSAVTAIAKVGVAAFAKVGAVTVAKVGATEFTEAGLVRIIQRGEKLVDLTNELKALTFTTNLEHAIVSLKNGTRAIFSGGEEGIRFAGNIGDQLKRIILHTHPETTGPSALDFIMLERLGQRSSWLYELFGGGLTKFTRKF